MGARRDFSLGVTPPFPISPFPFLSFPFPLPLFTLYSPPCQIQHLGRAVSQTIVKISWCSLPSSPFPHFPYSFPHPPFPFSSPCLFPACRACDYVYIDNVRRSRSSSCRLLRPINCQTYITLHYISLPLLFSSLLPFLSPKLS